MFVHNNNNMTAVNIPTRETNYSFAAVSQVEPTSVA